jgi:hypothetical protein
MTFRHSELLRYFNLSSTYSCLHMGNRYSFCKCSFLFLLYYLSGHWSSGHPCGQFEYRYFSHYPCEQFEKSDLRDVSLLRTLIQIALRQSELSIRFMLYLLINCPISLPCGFTTKQQPAECRSFARKIRNTLRISISVVLVNLYYSVSTYLGYPCEYPFRWRLFTEITLYYLTPTYVNHPCEQLLQPGSFTKVSPYYSTLIYLSHPCEQPFRLGLFIETGLSYLTPVYFGHPCGQPVQPVLFTETYQATKIQFFLRRAASRVDLCLLRDAETTLPEKNLLTSWDRTVSDIAIVDISCTGIPHNTS